MRKRPGERYVGVLVGASLGAALAQSLTGTPSALSPASPEAARVALWWWILFAIACVAVLTVVTLLLMAVLRRKRPGDEDTFHPDPAGERRRFQFVLWVGAVIPALILGSVMGLNVFSEVKVAENARKPALTIEVIGHRWWWEVYYPQQGFTTANELHVPAGAQIELKLTTADVIHSFWVPELHGKVDLIPGQTNVLNFTADKAGLYRGQCAEYCGLQHAHMAVYVVAQTPAAFQAWAERQRQPASLAAR